MADFTRTTHTVRIKSNDKRFYADVEILDAIAIKLPNNFDICYKISKPNIVSPNIIDNTGDGNGKPGNSTSTRASHMVRVTSTTVQNMFFDVEVCDAFTITGPNNADFCIKCPTPGAAAPAVIDDTDSGLAVGANEHSTRGQHVVKLLQQVGSGKAGQPNKQVPTSYTLTLLTDAMSYSGPNTLGMPWQSEINFGGPADVGSFTDFQSGPWYEAHALKFYNFAKVMNGALDIGANTNDTTKYVEDPGTGEQVPPDLDPSTDPNVYVYFPQSMPGPAPTSTENTAGPFLGKTPYAAKGAPGGDGNIPAIDMGPIWWLRALGCTDNVWFWFICPVQQPMATSFFGDPPAMANPGWGYRGWTILPDFPVTWILSVNYPLVGMGTYGAPNLVTAAGGTIMGKLSEGGSITVNWDGIRGGGVPDGHFGVSTQWVVRGGLGVGLPLVAYTLYSYYMPFGAFDLAYPTKADQLAFARANHIDTSVSTDYGGPPPNIWELTGLPQPPLFNPKKIWDPTTNPHQQPSLAQAKQVAEKFRDNWNATASDLTARAMACTSNGIPGYPNTPPPVWHWALPYGGDSLATAQMFSNGYQPGVLMDVTVPVTVPTIEVGQLDPKIWDVTPVLKDGNPPVPRDWTSYTLSTWVQDPLDQNLYDLGLTLGTP